MLISRRRWAIGYLFLGVLMAIAAGCASTQNSVQPLNDDGSLIALQNEQARVVIDAAKGRIMEYALRQGANIGRNVIWTNLDARDQKYYFGDWLNWGGDKVWPWPQSRWNWPPPEPRGGYQLEAHDGKVLMSGQLSDGSFSVTREVELNKTGDMTVTSRFKQADPAFTAPTGVWSITQIPHPLRLYARIPDAGDRKRYLERTRAKADRFETRLVGHAVVELEPNFAAGGKTFMDGDVIAAVYDDVVLLQRMVPIHSYGTWATDERCQVYVHLAGATNVPPGRSYIELEWSGPKVSPPHMDKAPIRIVYKLVPITPQTTQEEIIRLVDELQD